MKAIFLKAALVLSLLYHPSSMAGDVIIASKSLKEIIDGHLARDGNKTLIEDEKQFRFYAVKWPEIYSYTSTNYQGDLDEENKATLKKTPFCTLSTVSYSCEVSDFRSKLVVTPMQEGLMVTTYGCRFNQGTCDYVLHDLSIKRWIK